MRRVRKNNFLSWKKFLHDNTFMYQGFLLLLSAVVSVILYSILLALFLNFADYVFVSRISEGEIITTVSLPILWSTVVILSVLFALFLFSELLSILFGKVFKVTWDDLSGFKNVKTKKIFRRVRGTMFIQYLFYISVYVFWLYASVIFSLIFRNGMVRYSLIFVCLTFLSFFAKKLFCYPVYILMMRSRMKEKLRRAQYYFVTSGAFGNSQLNSTRITLQKDHYANIYAALNRAVGDYRLKVRYISIILGSKVNVDFLDARLVDIDIGVAALNILTEEELSAYVARRVMLRKNKCLDRINRFFDLNRSLEFAKSSWNPLERIYKPFDKYIRAEKRIIAHLRDIVETRYMADYSEHVDLKTFADSTNAELKLWAYNNCPFGYDKAFIHSLFEGKNPVGDYHKRVLKRYFEFIKSNESKFISAFEKLTDDCFATAMLSIDSILKLTKEGLVDLKHRPLGEYGNECKQVLREFDRIIQLCARINYRKNKKQHFLDPKERIRKFETDRMHGEEKSDKAILEIARDYLDLVMPREAKSLALEVKNKDSDAAKSVIAEAMLKCGEFDEARAIIEEPDFKISARLAYVGLQWTKIFPDYNDAIQVYNKCYLKNLDAFSNIKPNRPWELNELTGKYVLKKTCSASTLTDHQKEKISVRLVELCKDRFEWAAAIRAENHGMLFNLIVVNCSDNSPYAYTDCYLNGIYTERVDILCREITCFNEFELDGIAILFDTNAPIEAFETPEGSIISHKGQIEAKRILAAEARRYELMSSEVEFVEIDEEHNEEENEPDVPSAKPNNTSNAVEPFDFEKFDEEYRRKLYANSKRDDNDVVIRNGYDPGFNEFDVVDEDDEDE